MPGLPEILVKHKGKVLDASTILAIIEEACATPDRSIPIESFAPVVLRGYTFAVERYATALPELMPLHAAHWQETEKYRHGLPLNPDYDGFIRNERAGALLLFTIRKDGELVGQSTMKIYLSMHSQTLVANEDSLFLRADHRGSLALMLGFIRYLDGILTQTGVREARVSSKIINGADKLLQRAGFTPFAMQLVKMLGVAHEIDSAA